MAIHKAIVGPPGTGKTARISADVAKLASQRLGGEVLVLSLTRAAAAEAAARVADVLADPMADPRGPAGPGVRVGNIHSVVYRMLDRPKLWGKDEAVEWRRRYPAWEIVPETRGGDEVEGWGAPCTPGARVFAAVNIHRTRMTPREQWSGEERRFYDAWTDFKAEAEVVDFTDLLELAVSSLPLPPRGVRRALVDEAQDFSKLEAEILRRWEPHLDAVTMVGDPDQALYTWRGADPSLVTAGAEPEVLAQSYRVPRAVHKVAAQITSRIPGRLPVEYRPRDDDGEVMRSSASSARPEPLLPLIESEVNEGRTVMVIALCSYMLGGVQAMLRQRGIAYHNPFSDRWNHLRSCSGTATADRLAAFLRPVQEYLSTPDFLRTGAALTWTVREIELWSQVLRASAFASRGVKTDAKSLEGLSDEEATQWIYGELGSGWLEAWFEAEDGGTLAPVVSWFARLATKRYHESLRFPLRVLEMGGWGRLTGTPQVVLGTIHSVKGGEADTVAVLPDLSPAAHAQGQKPGVDGVDALRRTYYVAATRARHRLVLCAPSNGRFFRVG